MPIPKPKKGEKKQDFVSRCITQLSSEDPDMSPKQVQAICFDTWAKRGECKMDDNNSENEVRRDEDGHIIVAENVKITFSGFITENIDTEEE